MADKICRRCDVAKPLEDFSKCSGGERPASCKACLYIINKPSRKASYERRKKDPEFMRRQGEMTKKQNMRRAKMRLEDPQKYAALRSGYLKRSLEKRRAYQIAWNAANPEWRKATVRNWRKANRERINAKEREKRARRRAELIAEKAPLIAEKAAYYAANKQELDAVAAALKLERRANARITAKARRDAIKARTGVCMATHIRRTKPKELLRSRLNARLQKLVRKGSMKTKPDSFAFIGCTGRDLRIHIEQQFQPGMSWERRHLWHIDHIRPCNTFDLTDPAQQAKCFHYTNLRPLWALDNLRRPKDGGDAGMLDGFGDSAHDEQLAA